MEEAERNEISTCAKREEKRHLENPGTEGRKRKESGSKAGEQGYGEKRKMRQLPKERESGSGVWGWGGMFQEGFEVAFKIMYVQYNPFLHHPFHLPM